jgi:hypothetical protein
VDADGGSVTVAYHVTGVGSAVENPHQAALAATGLPRLGAAWPADARLRVARKTAEAIGANQYRVTVFYERREVDGGTLGGSVSGDPLAAPPTIEWSKATSSEPIDRAYNPRTDKWDIPITNPVGEFLDPPVHKAHSDPVLRIGRNEATHDPRDIVRYVDSTNADAFHGVLPGLARMTHLTATRVTEHGRSYWRRQYEIVFRADGWRVRRPNVAHFYREAGTEQLLAFVDDEGHPLLTPQPVKADGTRITKARQLGNIAEGRPDLNVTWSEWTIYRPVSWTRLQLPWT